MARTRWPPGPVNPGLLPRPGRSDRQRRWVPEKPGARPASRSQDSPSGAGRFGGQAGTQAPDATPAPAQNHGSRAGSRQAGPGSTIHILPAESAWLNTVPALAGRRTPIIQLGAYQRRPKSGFGHVIVYGGSWPGGQDSLASAGLADAMRPVALALGGRAGPGLRARRDDGGKIPVGLGRGYLAKCRRACRWATRISARG